MKLKVHTNIKIKTMKLLKFNSAKLQLGKLYFDSNSYCRGVTLFFNSQLLGYNCTIVSITNTSSVCPSVNNNLTILTTYYRDKIYL